MTSSSDQQEAAARAFAIRDDLQKRVLKESFYRTNAVRRTVGYSRLPKEELEPYALSAIGHGFFRALIEKYSEAKGLTAEWWADKRRTYGKNGRDRTADLLIVGTCCPDFVDFYVPLTDDEVVEAAKVEFYDQIAAGGSDYHQLESQRKQGAGSIQEDVVMLARSPEQGWAVVPVIDASAVVLDADAGDIDFVDPTAQDRVENVLLHNKLMDEADPFGPIITRAATVALREFGPNGLFWLIERLFLPTRYTEVLRALGGTEEELGKNEFERVKRDMIRKLPEVNERMMALLKDDDEMGKLRDMLWNDGTRTGRLRSGTSNVPKEDALRTEKKQSLLRTTNRLLTRLQAEDEAELVEYIESLPVGSPEVLPFLHEFMRCGHDSSAWQGVKRKMQKAIQKAA